MHIQARFPITFFFLCGCASLLMGQSNQTAKKSPVAAPSAVLTFTPPPSVARAKASEFLSALRTVGDEYKTYELSNARTEIQAREMSVYVANDVKGFSNGGDTPGVISVGKPVDDQARVQTTVTILRSIQAYLNKKCRAADQADLKVMVMLSGSSNETYIGSDGYSSFGIINIKLFLLDTKLKRVIWYTDKAWGRGKSLPQAADFASESIAAQLDHLFGVSSTLK
jgi:hypothetical protein